MDIVAAVRSDTDCHAIVVWDLARLRDEQVILTKSALHALNREAISRLRALGHRLVADFLDLPVDKGIASAVDFLVASSISQHRFFQRHFPQIPALHVTHHVDLRMPIITVPMDRARFGYFGKLANCLHAKAISDLVHLVAANDALDTSWMSLLSESNAHYAIRVAERPGVFKPFLKGFTAAHCDVPIIVADTDEEARHYLGDDYPFVVTDLSLRSIREHIERFTDEYVSSTWKSAVKTMRTVKARTSRQHVEHELRAVLNAI